MAVGALEPQFYKALCEGLGWGTSGEVLSSQMDVSKWGELKEKMAARKLMVLIAVLLQCMNLMIRKVLYPFVLFILNASITILFVI